MRIAMFLLAAFIACLGTDAYAQSIWRHLPQHPIGKYTPPVFADLDGDGTSEIVFIAQVPSRLVGGHAAIGVLRKTFNGFAMSDAIAVDREIIGQIVVVDSPMGPDTLLANTISESAWGDQLVEYAGVPLRVKRIFESDTTVQPSFVGDVDGDGELEIIGTNSHGDPIAAVFSLSYSTGVHEWLVHIGQIFDEPSAGQLDDDPSLEIVVPGTPGRVLDGVDGAQDWHYPEGFPGRVVFGRFGLPVEAPTFATVGFDFNVFRSQPYGHVGSYATGRSYPASIFDFHSDGTDEVLFGASWGQSTLGIVEPIKGTTIEIPIPWAVAPAPAVGIVGPGMSPVIVHGNPDDVGWRSRGVQILQYPGLQQRYRSPIELGPFSAVGFGRMGGEDDRVVLLSGRETPGSPGHHSLSATVWNSAGTKIAERLNIVDSWDLESEARVHMSDLDGIAGDEIVAAFWVGVTLTIVALDGTTLDERWRVVGGFGEPLAHHLPADIDSADIDGDGLNDIVMTVQVAGEARLVALSGLDGTLRWQSETLEGGNASIFPRLAVADVDADGIAELVVANVTQVRAFDAETKLLDWSYSPSLRFDIEALAVWGEGDQCRIGVTLSNRRFLIHRCSDRSHVATIDLPGRTTVILPVDETGSEFALVANNRVWRLDSSGAAQAMTIPLGFEVDAMTANALWRSPEGHADLLVGSTVSVDRVRFRPGKVFANGFELQE